MVRVFIKGGVWKNSEDEILKAAIMKYGKQQWARVASLLNRKSAKQCKARWNEWLDPAVRKVEWSREEEERLLHLAKLMPAQWRTIGGLLEGRSASQCQERYERLLDGAASGTTDDDDRLEALRTRALRPGDIDSHPETKPARPDPVDMDEDEIEMLQEARARLANTQGKKAKRKGRERALNEARRLADLQKRRELKQAGLLSSSADRRKRRRRDRREIDLGAEIPFHKPAPAGFHDTSAERERAEAARRKRAREVDLGRVNENQRRARDREAAERRRREENRVAALERANAALAVAKVSRRNDPVGERKRGALNMPAPEVDDDELRRAAKIWRKETEGNLAASASATTSDSATDALLSDYTDRPLPTPLRTPRTRDAGAASVPREVDERRRLDESRTPLLGAVTAATTTSARVDEEEDEDDRKPPARPTPPPSATPVVERPPSVARSLYDGTPHRDALGLNDDAASSARDGAASVTSSAFFSTASTRLRDVAREERRAAKRARAELEAALRALPAPQFEYELAMPDEVAAEEKEDEDEDDGKTTPARDRAELDTEERERRRQEAAKARARRSAVLRRTDLPRPRDADALEEELATRTRSRETVDDEDDRARALVAEEMVRLVRHDAVEHPTIDATTTTSEAKGRSSKKKRKKSKKRSAAVALENFSDDALDAARALVENEAEDLLREHVEARRRVAPREDAARAREVVLSNATPDPSTAAPPLLAPDGRIRLSPDADDTTITTTKEQRVASLRARFDLLTRETASLVARAEKLEKRTALRTAGYRRVDGDLRRRLEDVYANARHAIIEEAVYRRLAKREERAAWDRGQAISQMIRELEATEDEAREEYERVKRERDDALRKAATTATTTREVV